MKTYAIKDADGDKDAQLPERDPGVRVHLAHHELNSMKLDGPLKHGTKVSFHGEGMVHESGTHDDGGEPRHHMTLVLHRAGVDYDEDEDTATRGNLRGDLTKAHADAATKGSGKMRIAALADSVPPGGKK